MSTLLAQVAEPLSHSKPKPSAHCPCGVRKHYYSTLCITCAKIARRPPILEEVFIVRDHRCRKIPLTRGQYALVYENDYEWLMYFYWKAYWCESTGTYYAHVSLKINGKWTVRSMHRMILNVRDDDVEVDHVDHDTLCNVRFNLRPCSKARNMSNRGVFESNTTGYIGVKRNKKRGKPLNSWNASVNSDGEHYYLGSFPSPEMAARARDTKAVELHGAFAFLNFPIHSDPPSTPTDFLAGNGLLP